VPPENFIGITLAVILRPHGLRGEVAASVLTDFPERLPELHEAWLSDGRTPPRKVEVRRCRLTTSRGGQAIFHFSGIDNMADAERLRGLEVQIPAEQRMRLAAGQHYVADLVECEVWESGASTPLGIVRGVEFPGAVPLLQVESGDQEILVPLAAEICILVDTSAKRIEVILPEGLRDLNRR
jgi:16S rRNA processing protein RimM